MRELKRFRGRDIVKDGGSNTWYAWGRYHQGKREEMQIEALKGKLSEELKEMYGREYHFRIDHGGAGQRPICIVILCR